MESRSLFSTRASLGMMVIAIVLVLVAVGLAMFGAALGGPTPTNTDSYNRAAIGHKAFYDLMEKLGNRPLRLTSVQHARVEAPIFFLEPTTQTRDKGRKVLLSNAILQRYRGGHASVLVLPKWGVREHKGEKRAVSRSTRNIRKWLTAALPKHIYNTLSSRLKLQRLLADADIGKRTPTLQTFQEPLKRGFHHPSKTFKGVSKPIQMALFLPQRFQLSPPREKPKAKTPKGKTRKAEKARKKPEKPEKPEKWQTSNAPTPFIHPSPGQPRRPTPPKPRTKPGKGEKKLVKPQIQVVLGVAKRAYVLLLTAPKRGNIWLVSDPDLLHNFNLQRGEHAILWYTMASQYLRHKPLLIDECFHGHTKTFSLTEELATFPKFFLVIQALLLLAFCGWYGGRRFGIHQPVEARMGRGPQEVIGITAWVLVCGRQVAQVAASYVERTLEDTAARLSLRTNKSVPVPAQLDKLAGRKGLEPAAEELQVWANQARMSRGQGTKEALRMAHHAWQFRRAMLARKGSRSTKQTTKQTTQTTQTEPQEPKRAA